MVDEIVAVRLSRKECRPGQTGYPGQARGMERGWLAALLVILRHARSDRGL